MKTAIARSVDDSHGVTAKVQSYHQAEIARNCYRAANLIVVLMMAFAFVPLANVWIWTGLWAASLIVSVLGIIMMIKRSVGNGFITLLFAWVILPGWFAAVPLLTAQAADGFKAATAKTAAERIALGQLAAPLTPSTQDGSITEAKEWIQGAVLHPEAIKYQHWSTTEQGEQLSTVVKFTTSNNRHEPVEERLKFVFNRYEKQPVSVFNQKTNNYLFERPRVFVDLAPKAEGRE